MSAMEALTVGRLAEVSGVTVRTLHHYDHIGLLTPSDRSHAGYRLYTQADLERLQHVVVYRRLGFSLVEIAELLDDVHAQGEGAAVEHLRRQRAAVMSRLQESRELLAAIDKAMERTMNNRPATPEEMKEILGDGFNEEYQAEAEQRWGDTPQWKQSRERTARMTKQDWANVKAHADELNRDLVAAVRRGEAPDSPAAAELTERHRASIETYYDCPPDFHAKLAAMYTGDERFAKYYNDMQPGLAQWLHDAIVAGAARQDS